MHQLSQCDRFPVLDQLVSVSAHGAMLVFHRSPRSEPFQSPMATVSKKALGYPS
jgi:hypothetical protein